MKVLVTGGAGYIGSHTVRLLKDKGFDVIVLDNLVYGHKESLPEGVTFIKGDISDKNLLDDIFKKNRIGAVIHFAAYAYVGESVKDPKKYFINNTINGLNLLNSMIENNVKKIVFSSSCAVYGTPKKVPISEKGSFNPESPYGETKLFFEKCLGWYDLAYNLNSVSLRYFNAAGASLDSSIGEDHSPETHLIPLVIQAALGKREFVEVFGTDYPTPDGTCIRDYVHVVDLAHAHYLALSYLESNKSNSFNLGSGEGTSVREIISLVKEITKRDFRVVECPKRSGDPPELVADSTKIRDELNWKPRYGIKDIIKTAWFWHKSHPAGF